MIPLVDVVSVERTPTVPSGDRLVVLVTVTGGFVIGCVTENKFAMLFRSVSQAFQVVADVFPTVKFMVRVLEVAL
jgi:hypothetical protein